MRVGFEPTGSRITGTDGLANRCLRPLSHLTINLVPRARLELARLSAMASKTIVATITPPGQKIGKLYNQTHWDRMPSAVAHLAEPGFSRLLKFTKKTIWCEWWGSNPHA